jgi:hypothetical protein
MIPNAEKMGQKILSCLDDKEIDILMDLLKRIRKHLFSKLIIEQKNMNVNKQKKPLQKSHF